MRSKEKGYLFSGIIDPVSIIGGLFLVAMLVVGTFVAKNKNFSFNINEKASCMTTCMNQVGDQAECNFTCKESTKVADKVTAPAPKPKAETTKLCGYCKDTGTCVSCTNGGENVGECSTNNDCNKGSVNLPPAPTQQPLTTTPIDNKLEQAEVKNIQEVITAPVVINGTVVNPATSVPVVEKPAETGGTNPVTVVTPPVVKTCSANGAQYPADSVVVYAGQGSYRKCVDGSWVNNCGSNGANEPCEITDLTPNFVPTYLGGQYQAAIDALQASLYPSEDYVAGPSQNSSPASINNTTSTISTSSTCNNSCPSTQKCVLIGMGYYGCQNISGPNSITTYATADINCSNKCATNQKCVASTSSEGNVCETVAYVPYEPKKPVVTTSVQDLIASLTDRFNSVNQNTGLTNLGTTSLGGGNAPVITAPLSVLTSNNPDALSDYYRGVGYSMGAGALTAAAVPAASTIYSTGLTTSALVGMNALSAASPTISALTVTGLTIGALDCQFGGGYLCETAANTLFSGYALSPEGTMQMFQQAGQVYSEIGRMAQGAYSALSNIQRIPVETRIDLNDITVNTNGVIIDGSFIDDGVSIANTLASANETASLAIVQNQIPQLTSGAIVQQPNLALLTNVFLNNSQLPVALSVANLNANAVGGSNPFSIISPSSSSYLTGGASGINSTQNQVNLQTSGNSNGVSTNPRTPMYYGHDEDPTITVAELDWKLRAPNKKPLVMYNGHAWDPDELAKYLKSLEGLSVNPNVTNTWRDRMPPIEDAFQLGKLGYDAEEIAAMQTSTTPQSRLAEILDELDINISFPSVTVRRWWDRLTGNVTTTEINPLPEIILDPLPETVPVTNNPNTIHAIAPDRAAGIETARLLEQNGWDVVIHDANIAPRVVDGAITNDPMSVAADTAKAIEKIYEACGGFGPIKITETCNTGLLKDFIKPALELLPEHIKNNIEILSVFDVMATAFNDLSEKTLLIGTNPLTDAVSKMNLPVDTLAEIGHPELQEDTQTLIWYIKYHFNPADTAVPIELRESFTVQKMEDLATSLDNSYRELGYTKIITACTELPLLFCDPTTYVSTFSLIKPPAEQTVIERVQDIMSSIIKEFLFPPNSNAIPTNSLLPETGGGKFKIKIPEWLGGSPAGDITVNPDFIEKNAAYAVYNYFVTNPKSASEIISDISNPLITKAFELTYWGDDYVIKYPVGPLETRVRFKNDVTNGQEFMVKHGLSENLIPATFVDTPDGPIDIQKFKEFDETDLFMNLPEDKKQIIIRTLDDHDLTIMDPHLNIYWKEGETWKVFDPEFVSEINLLDRIKDTPTRIQNWWYEKGPSNWFGGGSPAGDIIADSGKTINTTIYNGPDLQIISRSEADELIPADLDKMIAQAEAGGIRINREGDFVSAGFDSDGIYSLTLPQGSDPLSELHELIHLDQDFKALQAGVSISQLDNLPPYNRALYEIQASTETLKYMDKWEIDDDIARIQEEINIEESIKVLEELGEEVPERIAEPWKSIPLNENVEHLTPVDKNFTSTQPTLLQNIQNWWYEKGPNWFGGGSPASNIQESIYLRLRGVQKSDIVPIANIKDSFTQDELEMIEYLERQGITVYMMPGAKIEKMGGIDAHPEIEGSKTAAIANFPRNGSVTISSTMISTDIDRQNELIAALAHELGHIKGTQIPFKYPFGIPNMVNFTLNEVLADYYAYMYFLNTNAPEAIRLIAYEKAKGSFNYHTEWLVDRAETIAVIGDEIQKVINPTRWFK